MSKLNENVKDLFDGWNTIPNWLCFLRIALIPVFSVLFIKQYYIAAFITMIICALTDLFDGKIARKFNQVSNLGKILDPVADKLSQMAIIVILIVKYWSMEGITKYLFFLFIAKELIMILGGVVLLAKGMRPTAAEMWGKVATTVFYISMIAIIAIGPGGALSHIFELPQIVVTILVVISVICAFVSLFGYVPGFFKQLKENREAKTEE